jgi:hypothetical protein
MAYLGSRPSTNFRVAPTKDTFTGDGSTTTFDLANKVPAGGENALQVFVENVRQEPGSGKAYTLGADGSGDLKRITFSSAPVASAEIYVITTFSNEAFISNTDLNGSEFVLDADGDTSITADTDDTIDIKIAGADDFSFTANTFTAKTGSSIVVPDGGITLGSTAVGSTAAELNLLDGSAKSTSSITVADADAFIVIDGTTTKQIPASDIKTYAGLTVSNITGATELATQPASDDEIVISDGGVLKRLDIKHIQNTPSFRAFHSSTQNVANNTLTTLSFDSETFDSDGTYDTSTGRFTPAVAGKYVVFANVRPNDTNVYQFELEIRTSVENAIVKCSRGNSANAGDSFFAYTIADLSVSEYAFVTAYHTQGGTRTLFGGTAEAFFGGFRLTGL